MLARSVRGPGDTFVRRYPAGGLFAHAVGYSYVDLGRSGIEKSHDDELTGRRTELVTAFESILGRSMDGDDVRTTLDPRGQRTAIAALAGRKGAVVALDVHTGAVRVMASVPGYDPNTLQRDFRRLTTDEANAPLLNRATQNGYPPGSTMKVVTAAAALDTGDFKPSSIVDGTNGKIISGVPLNNFGGESFGPIDLTTALTNSVNTVWARGRGEAGPADDAGLHGALRLLRRSAPGLPGPADDALRGAQGRPARPRDPPRGRRRPRGHRPGRPVRDAAADGRGRGHHRQRRRAHEAVPDEPAVDPDGRIVDEAKPRRPPASSPPPPPATSRR